MLFISDFFGGGGVVMEVFLQLADPIENASPSLQFL